MGVEACNKMLADLGTNPLGDPIYRWARASDLWFYRWVSRDWVRNANGIYVPDHQFERYRPFEHLGDRWCLCIWQWMPEDEFVRQFGERAYWPARGFYFPTDKVLKPGVEPTKDLTEYIMACIRYTRSKTLSDLETEVEDALTKEERASFSRILDAVNDALTAFGNKPGSRSGGVSFPCPTSA